MLHFNDTESYENAVCETADRVMRRHGDHAVKAAWQSASMPNLTKSERAYCHAVAVKVTQQMPRS